MSIISYQVLKKDEQINSLISTQRPKQLNGVYLSYTPEIRIEQQLLTKYAKSQAKLSAQRLKKQRQEAKSLQEVPKINQNSKDIAKILEGKADNTISGYASQIVSSCRSSTGFQMHPKHSFISLADLSEEPVQRHRKTESQQFIHLNLSTIKEKLQENQKKVKSDPKEQERIRMEELKKLMAGRKNSEETENPTEPLYEMGILERNQFWLDRKNQRIQIKIEEKIVEESKSCTFNPTLAPRIICNRWSRPNSQNSNSYADKHKRKEVMSSTLQKPQAKPSEEKPPKAPSSLYKALSPHSKPISQHASISLLKNAIPMIPYKT